MLWLKKNKTNVICDTRSLEEKIKNPPINYTVREFSLDIFKIYPSKLNFFDTLITFQINKKYTTRFFFQISWIELVHLILERSRKTNQKLIKQNQKFYTWMGTGNQKHILKILEKIF